MTKERFQMKNLLKREAVLAETEKQIGELFTRYDIDASQAIIILYMMLDNIYVNCKDKELKLDFDPLHIARTHLGNVDELWGFTGTSESPDYFG